MRTNGVCQGNVPHSLRPYLRLLDNTTPAQVLIDGKPMTNNEARVTVKSTPAHIQALRESLKEAQRSCKQISEHADKSMKDVNEVLATHFPDFMENTNQQL